MHHPLPSSRTGLQRRPEDYVFRIWHSVVQAKKCPLLPVICRNCWYFSFHFRKGSASCGVANLSSNCVWIVMASLCIWICALIGSAWLSRIKLMGQAKRSCNACVATVSGSVVSQNSGGLSSPFYGSMATTTAQRTWVFPWGELSLASWVTPLGCRRSNL